MHDYIKFFIIWYCQDIVPWSLWSIFVSICLDQKKPTNNTKYNYDRYTAMCLEQIAAIFTRNYIDSGFWLSSIPWDLAPTSWVKFCQHWHVRM